ncbi:molybdopterin molybdotransferase MoeA [Lipingzhangella sp. LS1_29]|uniref:Molybdopterin molybdenumtransferase n=1 Tax=Lipingzhangella rawalii TaxID=2055835 RepID=A0ABU2H2T4_9ACTN|nr:molybdopterin molybdotransferase MoeA [Lipingzhangella rawalii]MDS1269602.1 molybdopterin molybdotransferase MoeA [Lipingzhangella rawalii]
MMMSASDSHSLAWAAARSTARELGATVAQEHGDQKLAHTVALAQAHGAALATDLVATSDVPTVDTAAMDGYAVCGAGPWTVLGRTLAGAAPTVTALAPGQALEIATGAPVPHGTESVLPYEQAEHAGDDLSGNIAPGRHVRRRGEDITVGQIVLPAGTQVTPSVSGLAASLGYDGLEVRRPPVCLLVTGDEVRTSGQPGPGEVRDAIGPVVPGLVGWAGGTVTWQQHLGDDDAELGRALARAQAETAAPVIVVGGASSAGPADHLRSALQKLGADIVVDGVACRPGHPQLLAWLTSPLSPPSVVVGLPGNPYAALGAALTLLVPAVAACANRVDPTRSPALSCVRSTEIRAHDRDTRLVAVRLRADEAGQAPVAAPVGHDRPASLWGTASADALAVVPPRSSHSTVDLLWLPR